MYLGSYLYSAERTKKQNDPFSDPFSWPEGEG